MTRVTSDIVIIGAGITGTSTAIFLAQQGLKVVLLDKDRLGAEASGRSGGGVRQQCRLPPERKLAMQAIEMWHEMQHGWGLELEYIRGGSYRLILSESAYEETAIRVTQEQADGLNVDLLDADQTRDHLPFMGKDIPLLGSSHCASDGSANSLLTMQALGRLAEQNGVRIKTGEAVRAFALDNDRLQRVRTPKAEYGADAFVNTAGPWASTLTKQVGFELPIQRKLSKILITETVDPMFSGFISFDNGYLRQAADGNFHMGIKSVPTHTDDKHIQKEDFSFVVRHFTPLFPFLRKLHIIRAFAGITAWTPDTLPVIDVAPGIRNFYIAAGYSAHGFCLGPIVGKMLSDWIVSGKRPSDFEPFRLDRFG
jgi:sarcosine oxidase subunit beta